MIQKSIGTTLSVQQSNATVTIGRLRTIGEIRMTSDAEDITALDSPDGFREYAQGLRDAGEVTVEGFYDSTNAGQTLLRTLYLSGNTARFTVQFPDTSGIAFTAFVRQLALGAAQVDKPVAFSAVLRITGKAEAL